MRLRFLRMTTQSHNLNQKIRIKIKGRRTGVSDPHGQSQKQRARAPDPPGQTLREFEAVGLVEEVPGFAVGIVAVAFAAAFGA